MYLATLLISTNCVADLFSSAMVLVLAELCPNVLGAGESNGIRQSWDQCQRALERMSLHNDAAKQCAKTLSSIRQQIDTNSNRELSSESYNLLLIHKSAQNAVGNQNVNHTGTATYSYPAAIATDVQVPEQTSLNDTENIQGAVDNGFLFTDTQFQEMLSQNMGLQPPWNLDDMGWANMMSQNYP